MNFGITLPYLDARKTADLAHLAEDSGWDGVFVGDAIWCLDPMIALTAAAMLTSRIRLGTLIIPAPLNTPWKLASQSAALDLLSGGRLILGLAMGATWMGWHAFPDVPTDAKTRAEMLDETIDILTQLHQRKQFDYAGKHFKVNLTALDPMHYPPQTIQQPHVPIWIPGAWPRKKSMQRVLKTDGLLAAKMSAEGKFEEVTPADVCEMKAYIDANRSLSTPFDIVIEGKTGDLSQSEAQDKLQPWRSAGVTWWIESLWGSSEDELASRIKQGPPRL